MHLGRIAHRLAAADTVSPEARAAIREELAPLVTRLRHDLSLVLDALDGPDPEYALSLFIEVMEEVPESARAAESRYAQVHLRAVA